MTISISTNVGLDVCYLCACICELKHEIRFGIRVIQRTFDPGAIGFSGLSTMTFSPSDAASNMP